MASFARPRSAGGSREQALPEVPGQQDPRRVPAGRLHMPYGETGELVPRQCSPRGGRRRWRRRTGGRLRPRA